MFLTEETIKSKSVVSEMKNKLEVKQNEIKEIADKLDKAKEELNKQIEENKRNNELIQ